MVKVSIIIAAYNIEDYIERCLISCMNQTFNDIEIVVVNDGSTDSTLERINKCTYGDSRVKIIDKKNKKYGFCNTIFVRKILEEESVILFQNAFPTLEKYIDHVHTSNGAPAKVGTLLKNEILNNFKNLLKLKSRGYNVFFTDIDKIKEQMLKELDNSNKQKNS